MSADTQSAVAGSPEPMATTTGKTLQRLRFWHEVVYIGLRGHPEPEGAIGHGPSLLTGLVVCGRCGLRTTKRDSDTKVSDAISP